MMVATHELSLPLRPEDARQLKLGDSVYLTGEIHSTAGIPTHERMLACLDKGEPLPFDLRGGALFHLGSYNEEVEGQTHIRYLNPTTSTRFNKLMPRLIEELGLAVTGGKGGLDAGCAAAMKRSGCVYLSFLGGGAPIITDAVEEVTGMGWPDMISHYRLARIQVRRLGPLTVAIDAFGNSLYDNAKASALQKREEIIGQLREDRARWQENTCQPDNNHKTI